MSGIFGHAWTTSYGKSDEGNAWLEGLADMTTDEIKRGLAACLNWNERFPPNLPQFRALCRPPVDPHHAMIQRETERRAQEKRLAPPPEMIEERRKKATHIIQLSKAMLRHTKKAEDLISQTISNETNTNVAGREESPLKSPQIKRPQDQTNEEWLESYREI